MASSRPQPVSIVAERAVRYLKRTGRPTDSVAICREVLASSLGDERTARRLLESAFADDRRLTYTAEGWTLRETAVGERAALLPSSAPTLAEPDRALLLVRGVRRHAGAPFTLTSLAAVRLRDDTVIAACGGDSSSGATGERLRSSILDVLDGAVPVIHDPPGALGALERWLQEPLVGAISVRRLAHLRLGLGAAHDLATLAGRLGLSWRESEDLLDQVDALDGCLRSLRRGREPLEALRRELSAGPPPIDWSRFAFDASYLRGIPRVPGTYRFFDADGALIYVGKSKDLRRRIESYFREDAAPRARRVQALLDALHRIEYDAAGSELEAMLREARLIRDDEPKANVQRKVHPRRRGGSPLSSILILEPAEPPAVLRAYLIRDDRLVGRVAVGPRGGGLSRIERILDDHYFSAPVGAGEISGPDLDVEIVSRWLRTHRDAVVVFDPTDLGSSAEVITRLRWFLVQGGTLDPDGKPVFRR